MSPAFKEWHVIVEALGVGEQILILRKGGIAEDGGGFEVKAAKFWLFPTHFHEQLAKTKPAAKKFFTRVGGASPGLRSPEPVERGEEGPPRNDSIIHLHYFAEVVQQVFLSDWAAVARLDAFHLWSEETIRERFNWAQPPGLHAFAVHVHRLMQPAPLEVTPEMSGCKSWIDVPLDFAAPASEPVLNDAAFAEKLEELKII
ncbi:MAG TPA: DUF1802 family protein [Opitutaceae bacterium]|jgi:hypothetical protein|nr:DUF1802 family protein [Opitutaceae bacterium]